MLEKRDCEAMTRSGLFARRRCEGSMQSVVTSGLSGKGTGSMNVQEIACELIDVPPLDRKLRSSSKELVKKIAQSIELEGLFNPIVVRPNPEKPGRFILVQDRHRLYAVQKVNKEQFIRATIMTDMDDEDHRMATLS